MTRFRALRYSFVVTLVALLSVGCGPSASERANLKAQSAFAETQRRTTQEAEERQVAETARKLVAEEQDRQDQVRLKRHAEESAPQRAALRADIQVARGLVASSCGQQADQQANEALLERIDRDQQRISTELRSSGLEVNKNGMVVGMASKQPTRLDVARMQVEQSEREVANAVSRYKQDMQRIDDCTAAQQKVVMLNSKLHDEEIGTREGR